MNVNFCISFKMLSKKHQKQFILIKTMYPSNSHSNMDIVIVIILLLFPLFSIAILISISLL